ncbi:glutamate decarboxylase-like [Pollicipes pollicipes]|uniref:glutamate decarboxylase-like n=1 Tax=Pollicipes pollicipes TaxID=41117 RepID=UPI001884913C|nr:glutamate decarboxylase-like [Pollicipes pollicipes]
MAQNILRWVSDTVDTFKDRAKDTIDGHLPNGTGDPNRKPRDIKPLHYTDLLPENSEGFPETKEFLQSVVDILYDFIQKTFDRNEKVIDFHHPEELKRVLDLYIPEKGVTIEQLLQDCSQTLKYQVRTGHPRYMNQLSTGLETISLAGEWLTAAANTNMFTYEIAPVFILMEAETLQKMREIIGWRDHGDSILCPGGTISNLYAALVARHKMFPHVKAQGLYGLPAPLVMFTSEYSHYSIMTAGALIGLGTDNVWEVPCDKRGRMDATKLEARILEAKQKGLIPFFVNCTSGSTVVGAYDPIHAIADICRRYKVWMHIDAAWGGGALLSPKLKARLFAGVERADSVTWNPHKQMGVLLQCSTIHIREDGLLMNCNKMCAEYLFQQDKHYDTSFDTGDKVIQCGRHNDIFKLWLLWRAKGDIGFAHHVEYLWDLTDFMVQEIKRRGDTFYLIWEEPECLNVCFWYVPARLRQTPHNHDREEELGKLCPTIKARMMEHGTLMVCYQPLRTTSTQRPNFFRNIINNQAVTRDDVRFMLDEIERLGHDL